MIGHDQRHLGEPETMHLLPQPAQRHVGAQQILRGESKRLGEVMFDVSRAHGENSSSRDSVIGTKAKPGAKGFGATPFAHVDGIKDIGSFLPVV